MGVIVLTSGDLGGSGSAGGISFGIVALLLSAVSYAVGAVYARRNARGLSPMTTALFQVLFAFVIVTTLAFTIEHPLGASITPAAAFSVVWLGLLGSGLAYLLFFRLLERLGPDPHVAGRLPAAGLGHPARRCRSRRDGRSRGAARDRAHRRRRRRSSTHGSERGACSSDRRRRSTDRSGVDGEEDRPRHDDRRGDDPSRRVAP